MRKESAAPEIRSDGCSSMLMAGQSSVKSSKDAYYDVAMAIAAYFTARTASETIREELHSGDEDFALRMVIAAIADFREIIAKEDAQAIKDFLVEPKSTGSIRWDTLLAASIGRECRLAGTNRPAWTYPKPLDTGGSLIQPRYLWPAICLGQHRNWNASVSGLTRMHLKLHDLWE